MFFDHYRILAVLGFSVLLVACVSPQPVPEDRFYRLPQADPEKVFEKPKLAGSIAVQDLRSNSLLRERAILYIKDNLPFEIQRYHYHFWSEVPTDLMRDHFVDFLERSNVADKVSRSDRRHKDYFIGGRLLKFERILSSSGPAVNVQIELFLERARDRKILVNRVFENSRKVDGEGMHQTVGAFGEALEVIYRDFIRSVDPEG